MNYENKSLAIQLGKNLQTPNNHVQISNTGSRDISLALSQHSVVEFTRRLGEALSKETYFSPSQILPISKAAARKNTQKGGRKKLHQGC